LNFILDTHLLIWCAMDDAKLSRPAARLIRDERHQLSFSSVSLWEIAIKSALGRADFKIDVTSFRAGLLANDYHELKLEGRHVAAFAQLPALHKDPFDRMLVAQAVAEASTLLTADATLGQYGKVVRLV
jgi:PIN domain nuclease of toxin-antitoxin system